MLRKLLVTLAAALALPAAAAAAPSTLIYGCAPAPGGDLTHVCSYATAGGSEQVVSTPGAFDDLSVSRDGSRIAFGLNGNVYTSALDGSGRTALFPDDDIPPLRHPVISPAGDRVAYDQREVDGPWQIGTVNSDGTGVRAGPSPFTQPSWWGDRLVAVRRDPGAGELGFACELDEGIGSCFSNLTVAAIPDYGRPLVSPDGRWVAAMGTTPPSVVPELHVFEIRTGKSVGVVGGKGPVGAGAVYAWSPDSRALAVGQASAVKVYERPPSGDGVTLDRTSHADAGIAWVGDLGAAAAKLKVTSATSRRGTVVVRGRLAPKTASLGVELFSLADPATPYRKTVTARRGRFAFSVRLGSRDRGKRASCPLRITFLGDQSHGIDIVNTRARGGPDCRR